VEIGVWNGRHAEEMIKAAQVHSSNVEYFGFDLFETIDPDLVDCKVPSSEATVRARLEGTGAKIHLWKGDTELTLPVFVNTRPYVDFVFIDGGHSVETIASDWENIKKVMGDHTVVLFDDYWNIESAGCKTVIDALDREKYNVEVLPAVDMFEKDWGTLEIRFAKVQSRGAVCSPKTVMNQPRRTVTAELAKV
jgi:hypothetical protein